MTRRRDPLASTARYRRLRAAFFKEQGPYGRCAICGGGVDMSLSGRTAFGPTVDHIIPTTAGGDFFDPVNWQLAHRRCNSSKGRGVAIVRTEPVSPNA